MAAMRANSARWAPPLPRPDGVATWPKMKPDKEGGINSLIVGEMQVVLAEKRTALSFLRTGIAIFVLPLSVLSVLIATSKYYEALNVLHFLVPLLLLSVALVGLAVYLIVHSIIRIRHYDRHIQQLKRRHSAIAEFIE